VKTANCPRTAIIRIDAVGLLARDITNVGDIFGVLCEGELFDLLRTISDEDVALRDGDKAPAVELEDLQLHDVVIEPEHIAPGALEDARESRIRREFFDDELMIHAKMVSEGYELVKDDARVPEPRKTETGRRADGRRPKTSDE
jgi:hypothetical protein